MGNVRLTYSDSDGDGSINPSEEIISEKNYYPFGLEHKGYNFVIQNENSVAHKFSYNGKENNPELGLDWYDFGARNYDPAIGRWMNIDPLAYKYNEYSPYNYVLNNPILFIDPDGKDPIDPRTGLPFKIDLWSDGVIYKSIATNRNNTDEALKSKISRKFLGIDALSLPRQRNSEGGRSPLAADKSYNKTSGEAKTVLKGIFGVSTYAGAPCDNCWNKAAESGSYSFLNSVYAESGVFQTDETSYNVITVEDNAISQVVELNLNSNDEFDINSVTTFEVGKGDVQTRTVTEKGWFGTEKEVTEKFRTLNVTETTQNYSNNQPTGQATTKTYQREEIIK